MQTAEIKRRFLEHFEKAGHAAVPSAPLPFDDPNLLFVNAGMGETRAARSRGAHSIRRLVEERR